MRMKNAGLPCLVEGCPGGAMSKGLCRAHHLRLLRYGDPLGGGPPRPRARDFWDYVDKSGECWLWTGHFAHFGYGRYKGKRAHRISFEMVHGPLPDGAFVLHSCDVPPCVNPDHLRLGTPADNMADRAERERAPRGMAATTRAKLTENDVRAIRNDPRSSRKAAPDYGVSAATVADIRRGRTWRWVA